MFSIYVLMSLRSEFKIMRPFLFTRGPHIYSVSEYIRKPQHTYIPLADFTQFRSCREQSVSVSESQNVHFL